MRRFLDVRGFRLCASVTVASVFFASAEPTRDYAAGLWSTAFYRPVQEAAQLRGVGLVNDETAFFATRSGISGLHDGVPAPLLEVADGDIVSFHLCHHRNSIFYEVLLHEGAKLSIFEYSLIARSKVHVRDFQDIAPSSSLACVDRLLLRASPASMLSISLQGGPLSVLREFHSDISGASDAITSLTVSYAADVYSRAEILGVVPHNRSVVRFRLAADVVGRPVVTGLEMLLPGGDGSDGPLKTATVHEPSQVLWTRDRVILADGCALREVRAGNVRTILGIPVACVEPAAELLEPVPWASRISRLQGLAGAADGTSLGTVLAFTGAQVVHVSEGTDRSTAEHCAANAHEAACVAQHACGWAEGDGSDQHLCLDCVGLQHWADGQACAFESAPRAGTRYGLAACGCLPPQPGPEPGPITPAPGAGGHHHEGIWAFLVFLTLLVGLVVAFMMYRAHRRAAAMRELYGADTIDTAEFHTFTDDDCPHN
mmetsp:Transcript_76945/g.213822  ORF Transcript_76945/g.213822 Transcript_76945/m.213822 type:complete len:486 (-) Transcript_76945:273-1730(-)